MPLRHYAFEIVGDGVEYRAELIAQDAHGDNGGNGNQRGDEAIFDGGGAGFSAQKLLNGAHFLTP